MKNNNFLQVDKINRTNNCMLYLIKEKNHFPKKQKKNSKLFQSN